MKTMTNEQKLDLLADMMDPVGEIVGDREVLALASNGRVAQALQAAIRNHKGEVLAIMAAVEGEDPATYRLDGAVLLLKAIAKWNELQEIVKTLFPSPPQSAAAASSGVLMENTEEKGP